MEFGAMVVWVILIIFGSLSAPFSIWQIGRILRERRRDRMEEMRIKAEQKLEEMRIKADLDDRILGSGSAVTDNLTAEMQALREEVRQLKNELEQLRTSSGTNYIR